MSCDTIKNMKQVIDEVIVISSDDEDVDGSDVIIIDSDDDEDLQCEGTSPSDDELPDINFKAGKCIPVFNNECVNVKMETEEAYSCSPNDKHVTEHLTSIPVAIKDVDKEKDLKSHIHSGDVQERDRNRSSPQEQFFGTYDNALPSMKSHVNRPLTGDLFHLNVPVCGRELGICPTLHHSQGQPTSVYFDTQIKTMLTDFGRLEYFALQSIQRKGVTARTYLSLDLIISLLNYLIGSLKDEVVPSTENLYVGFTILMKMLRFHPPCKNQMQKYYQKVCQDFFWDPLIICIEKAIILNERKEEKCEEHFQPDSSLGIPTTDSIDDWAAIFAQQRRKERQVAFHMLSGRERLKKLSFLFKFFSLLIERNVSLWILKCSLPKYTPFRRDSTPLIVNLLWYSIREEGHLNYNLRRLINILVASDLDVEFRRSVVKMVAAISAVIFVKDKNPFLYLNIGELSQELVRDISFKLQRCPSFLTIVEMLQPPWLKFHVCCSLLNIEEPANMYKVKEKFIQYIHRDFEEDDSYRLFSFAVYTAASTIPSVISDSHSEVEKQVILENMHALQQIRMLLHRLPKSFKPYFAFLCEKK